MYTLIIIGRSQINVMLTSFQVSIVPETTYLIQVMFPAVAIVALTVILWHLYAAWTTHSKRGFCTYLGSRVIVQL